jgi:hypothetical protein
MDIDKLFKALPRDLQWEILSEFLGTHVVRNGKLRRKILLNTINYQVKYLIRHRPSYYWLYKRDKEEDNKRVFAKFPGNQRMMFCRDFHTDETIYLYYKKTLIESVWEFLWVVRFAPSRLEDSIILEPFVKHSYPSYPFTNKKKSIFLNRLTIK